MTTLQNAQYIYMVGIKGVGMTALAQLLKEEGKQIQGSDTEETFFTEEALKYSEIIIHQPFSPENIPATTQLVITSLAYDDSHPEIQHAKLQDIPVITYQQALGEYSKQFKTIAITGTHGKTTTTALCGALHEAIGNDPTVLVGSFVPEYNGNARHGKGELFIVEADEYGQKVLDLDYHTLAITNIEFDHPDQYANEQEYKQVFTKAILKLPATGHLISNTTEQIQEDIVLHHTIISTKKEEKALIYATSRKQQEEKQTFNVLAKEELLLTLQTSLPGEYNVQNILTALATIPIETIKEKRDEIEAAIKVFQGTKRRFEHKGTMSKGAIVIDDYAHHPTEVKATLKAARERYPEKNIWCIFHPHTFSRTKALQEDFAKAFNDADKIGILPVYSSAREKQQEITAQDIAKTITGPAQVTAYTSMEEAIKDIQKHATVNDCIITMGAGDVWQIAEAVIEKS